MRSINNSTPHRSHGRCQVSPTGTSTTSCLAVTKHTNFLPGELLSSEPPVTALPQSPCVPGLRQDLRGWLTGQVNAPS